MWYIVLKWLLLSPSLSIKYTYLINWCVNMHENYKYWSHSKNIDQPIFLNNYVSIYWFLKVFFCPNNMIMIMITYCDYMIPNVIGKFWPYNGSVGIESGWMDEWILLTNLWTICLQLKSLGYDIYS